ncbi:hypothetical protein HanXRQr2_Chr12g0563981 [Helianthus annuus]|uniref:Uncharacterized protein n=1 Tax=Helianthus annuus TaxID=4232 RepID=A0A9K3HK07_HELAN|nr:hypothetical protein HanXRQr2_Chr12g0563981 [Helianthus annuus]
MSDSNSFYFRHSYGLWCRICGGEHEELKCYFLTYSVTPRFLETYIRIVFIFRFHFRNS